jgi:hypothetical protein
VAQQKSDVDKQGSSQKDLFLFAVDSMLNGLAKILSTVIVYYIVSVLLKFEFEGLLTLGDEIHPHLRLTVEIWLFVSLLISLISGIVYTHRRLGEIA